MKTLILVAALLSSACTPLQEAVKGIPAVENVCTVASGTLIDEKVLYGAEALYNVTGQAYLTANSHGKITPELKAVLKPKLIKLYDLLKDVRKAKGAVNCDYAAMKELVPQIIQLLPR